MIKIGILSDTHGVLPTNTVSFFEEVDEIWHAGDIGRKEVVHDLLAIKPLRAVYGNIDGQEIRNLYPEHLFFMAENVSVLMVHTGGYPGRYDAGALKLIKEYKPSLFVCGHSHILRVIFDRRLNMLCINPGAAGNYGLHTRVTMVRLCIDHERIFNLEIFDSSRARIT